MTCCHIARFAIIWISAEGPIARFHLCLLRGPSAVLGKRVWPISLAEAAIRGIAGRLPSSGADEVALSWGLLKLQLHMPGGPMMQTDNRLWPGQDPYLIISRFTIRADVLSCL